VAELLRFLGRLRSGDPARARHGNHKGPIAVWQTKYPPTGEYMYHIIFWTLCSVIAANIVVAVIAITKRYRDERKFGTFRSEAGRLRQAHHFVEG
jgi:hypothetical protein